MNIYTSTSRWSSNNKFPCPFFRIVANFQNAIVGIVSIIWLDFQFFQSFRNIFRTAANFPLIILALVPFIFLLFLFRSLTRLWYLSRMRPAGVADSVIWQFFVFSIYSRSLVLDKIKHLHFEILKRFAFPIRLHSLFVFILYDRSNTAIATVPSKSHFLRNYTCFFLVF